MFLTILHSIKDSISINKGVSHCFQFRSKIWFSVKLSNCFVYATSVLCFLI